MNKDIELRVQHRSSRLIIPDVEDSKEVGPIIDYADEPLLPLVDACRPLVPIIFNILAYVSSALQSTPDTPSDGLTRDESASIFLYTMEWEDEHRSLYSILNETLRTADREQLQPWYKYLKLLLTALVKIPCAPQMTVWRGIKKGLHLEFPRGTSIVWWSFSSCTTTLPVLENDLYLGYEGACLYPKKTELPKRRWYNKKRFIIPFSLLTAIMIVAIVLGATLGSRSTATASDGKCSSFVRKDGWDIPDNDILSSPVHEPDYASCCKQCQATLECISFTFQPSSQLCWPKRSMGGGRNTTGDTITGYNPNMCHEFLRKEAWDIPGNDILTSPVLQPDYASCCSQCQATLECTAFTYSPSSQQCSLKKSKDSGRNSTDDTTTGYLGK
ncbi:unnamed protein product [Rotaria sp. Silwood2]|nr:unnamed protein product [Rotaria sp. Silwood2]